MMIKIVDRVDEEMVLKFLENNVMMITQIQTMAEARFVK